MKLGLKGRRSVLFWALLLAAPLPARSDHAPPTPPEAFATLHIPRLEQGPTIADFAGMQPSAAFAGKMLKVDGFLQRDPKDGAPVSQKTEVYLGYTDKSLYVVCICFDSEPEKVRARMVRREQIDDDDQFGFVLDTFHDKKHAVFFFQNALGVQQDGIWSEQMPDYSFDMLWKSDAKLTGQGYIAWFGIPFKSLRFPATPDQTWGLFFERDIRRNNENAFYPHITSNAQGFLNQYSTVLSNHALTSLQNTKNMNADVLVTYLVHPGTAVYVRYSSNLQNLNPSLGLDSNGNLLRTTNGFINDGRQFFVKVSYLFRY